MRHETRFCWLRRAWLLSCCALRSIACFYAVACQMPYSQGSLSQRGSIWGYPAQWRRTWWSHRTPAWRLLRGLIFRIYEGRELGGLCLTRACACIGTHVYWVLGWEGEVRVSVKEPGAYVAGFPSPSHSPSYLFLVAAVTGRHRPSGVRRQKCNLSGFRRPEVQNQYRWTEIKLSAGLCYLQMFEGSLCLFQLLVTASSRWLGAALVPP